VPTNFGTAFAVGTLLNGALVGTQVVFGVLAHSTALLADAAHNFGHVLGLLLAWSASVAMRRALRTRRS
jgi:cobalt-zinc-cadmium efflux system protein